MTKRVERKHRRCQYCGTDITWRSAQARNCSQSCAALYSRAKRDGLTDQVPAVTGSNVVQLHADPPADAPRPRNARTRRKLQDDGDIALGPPPGRAATTAPMSPTKTYDDTLAALTKADRLEDPMAGAALKLAARIDNSVMDTGSSLAAMVKQLELALIAVMKDVRAEADPVDELRRIREEKQRAHALSS